MLRKCIPILAAMLLLLTSCNNNNRSESNGPDFNRSFAHTGSYVCSTEDTVFYVYGSGTGSSLLRYTDKATGISGPLCGKPECTHDSPSCNAYVNEGAYAHGLNNYDGRLYWIGRSVGSPGFQVISVAYDGTDRRTVRSLNNIENLAYNSDSGAQLHRGWLFFGGNYAGIKNGEVFRTTYVFAVPLDPDEEPIEVLSIEDYAGSVIYQPYGDSLYIATDDKMSDENYGIILYRWDMLTGELETLYRGATPFGGVREFWVTDDGILLHTPFKIETDEEGIFYNRSIYKFDFASGEIDLLYEFISIEGTFSVCAADGMFVGNNVTDDGELVLLVKDFNGNVILDETLEGVDWLERTLPMMFCGVDDDYFYFYSNSTGFDEHLVAVPRTGGRFQILWPTE